MNNAKGAIGMVVTIDFPFNLCIIKNDVEITYFKMSRSLKGRNADLFSTAGEDTEIESSGNRLAATAGVELLIYVLQMCSYGVR